MTRVANWRTVVGVLASFFVLQSILHAIRPDTCTDATWSLLAGGVLFGAFFMATDPVSSPVTNAGKWVYGTAIGAMVVLIRNFTGYVEGVTFAILLGNIIAPILDEVAVRVKLKRLQGER